MPHFPLRFGVHRFDQFICGSQQSRGRNPRKEERKCWLKWWGWSGGSLVLFIGLWHNSTNAFRYFEPNHLTWGRNGPTLFLSIGRQRFLHRFASPRCKLCDSTTCRPVPPRNLCPDFEAQTRKPSTDGFEAQTIKPPASSARPPKLDTCHLYSRPPGCQVFKSLCSTCTSTVLTRSTRSLLYVHLHLSMSPSVSHHGWSTGLLVPRSISTARPYLIFTSPRPPPPSSTPAHRKPRDMLHNPTHVMVSSQTQPKTRITLTITCHKYEPQGHISTLCSYLKTDQQNNGSLTTIPILRHIQPQIVRINCPNNYFIVSRVIYIF
jgi:hypothetical protein